MPILQWLDRDKDVKAVDNVPYRLLEQVDDLSYGDALNYSTKKKFTAIFIEG